MNDSRTVADDLIVVLDQQTFLSRVLRAEGRCAVEFMSYGCGYCRAIEPALQQVARAIAPDVAIFRVDITADPDLAHDYQIGGTPTFVMFLNGQEVGRSQGPSPNFTDLRDALAGPFLA